MFDAHVILAALSPRHSATLMSNDAVCSDINLATLSKQLPASYGAIKDAALVVRAGRVAWLGPRESMPVDIGGDSSRYSGAIRWVTPRLVDCHTHLVYGGNRAKVFEMRLTSVSYAQIAD